jgi:ribosomal subunit interface protein
LEKRTVKQPLEVRFLGMEASPAVEAAVRAKAAQLDQFRGDLMACRVTIALEHKHKHQGHPYAVRIDLTMSGQERCIDRVQHEDVYVALRDAFDGIKRQIEEAVRRIRPQDKAHMAEGQSAKRVS